MTLVACFLRDCKGSTAIEYALIGSIISVAIVAAAAIVGVRLNGFFQTVAGAL